MTPAEGACIDASAVAKLFLDQSASRALRDWYYAVRASGVPVVAPTLLPYEIGQVARREFADDPDAQRIALVEATRGIDLVAPDLAKTATLAPDLSFYDASYLAVALATRTRLVTYDKRLARAATDAGVHVVTPGAK